MAMARARPACSGAAIRRNGPRGESTNARALGSRGQTHQQAGRYDQAIADLTAALELEPTYAWALRIRRRTLRQAGHYEKARVDLERAVEVDPDDLSSRFEKLSTLRLHIPEGPSFRVHAPGNDASTTHGALGRGPSTVRPDQALSRRRRTVAGSSDRRAGGPPPRR
ncbi:tetratricopeptide repeat protein [Streptomyces griseoloalbus]|uniref:Tetratricopeptide repeat protein n=1 Tax=Streptomyces griseoloalbus TaxID=67303 RepID=A0ABV3E8V3_9ACTN